MTAMLANVIDATGEADVLHHAEVARPVNVNAEFLVKVVAAGVNPIEIEIEIGSGDRVCLRGGSPVVLGNDFSGHIVESPSESHPIKVGDEVYGMTMAPRFSGMYAEYIAVPATCIARKPRSLSHAEAAAVPLACPTAWGAVVDVVDVGDLIGNLIDDTASRSLTALKPGGLIVSVPGGSWTTLVEDAAAAHVALKTGHTRGKIVLTVSPG